jgi:hypothetical protein
VVLESWACVIVAGVFVQAASSRSIHTGPDWTCICVGPCPQIVGWFEVRGFDLQLDNEGPQTGKTMQEHFSAPHGGNQQEDRDMKGIEGSGLQGLHSFTQWPNASARYSPNAPVALPPIPEAALPALDAAPPAPAIPAAGSERCPKPGEPNMPDITCSFVSAPSTSGATKFNGPE